MSGATDPRDVLRRALIEIRSLKERLAAAEAAGPARPEPVAVVGIGCRFPGGADTPEALWRMLVDGQDGVAPRPPGRWTDAAGPREGGFLPDVEGFDARFFGIAPREAAAMDPQHRLLLEVAWEALEHASIDPNALAGSRTGVFVGLATNDFARRVPEDTVDRYFGVGSSPAVASGRLAYLLDLRGPCVTLDTACSSSLVAVHYAMRALRDRDCDTALAGGVSLMLGPSLGRSFVRAGMLAPDGRCKSFDARADGYGRAEGAGVVVLKRLADALRDGDPVLAVLRGSAINQDGRSAGLTAPNGPAQTALIRSALEAAGLAPSDIDYVEAHGTGTPLGDPIEWHALAAAFAGRGRPLLVGSIKSNIGHAEAAAGIAGLIKAVLAVGRGHVPPSLHFERRNPAISAGATPMEVPVAPRVGIRMAGVSAFGFSGTNAHVVLEAPPARDWPAAAGPGVLYLSAPDPDALRALAGRYETAFGAGLRFEDACHTAAVGRARFPWWIAVRSPSELAAAEASDAPLPAPETTSGPRVVLPTYPFHRERFRLPGGEPSERTVEPDDPMLAGTGGLAHLGVLLRLLGEHAEALADLTFPTPLVFATPRVVRVERTDGRIAVQSRMGSETDWTTHLSARLTMPGPAVRVPEVAGPFQPAAGLYARIAAAGFTYGDAARCLEAIALDGVCVAGVLGPDRAAREAEEATPRRGGFVATGRKHGPDGQAGLSPGVMEAAAQLAYALLPEDAPPVMLAGAGRLTCFQGGLPATVWLRRMGALPEGGMRADFGVCDLDGRVLLQVEGANFAPLPDNARRWSRVVIWQPVPLPPAGALRLPPAGAQPLPPADAQPDPFVWRAPTGAPAEVCAALLQVLPQVGERRFRVLTRGAQHTGGEATPPDLGQAAVWGMALAIMAERPALRCRLIDLDADAGAAVPAAELGAEDEPAIAWRGGRRLARRFETPARPARAAEIARLAAPGVLRWEPSPAGDPGPGMVRIGVVAAGLTFRDRLLFNGLAPPGTLLGADCAGIVEAVGPGVGGLREGDCVVALTSEPIADSVMAAASHVAPAPCADLVAAASMPVPYLTALAGLPPLGPDDCVLIHQAASATGLAAAELARRAGARIVLTAARHRHRWFAPQPILDSRAPESWVADMAGAIGAHVPTLATGATGQGVAASLAQAGVTVAFGAFEPAHLAQLDRVRVVNLDKRAPEHFDLDRVEPARKRELLARLAELPPLPRRVVPRHELQSALAGEGPLVGRTVVLMRSPPAMRVERGATYLVTGAAGALGRLITGWLAAAGGVVCLLDGVAVEAAPPHRAVQADAGDEPAMAALLRDLGPGLRGVFHCAAIVDDDRLEQQTPERLATVLRAKVDGAMVLDRLTRGLRLDQFVLFSSVVGVLPSARQAGYAAANAVLDQIAHARQQRGLPGLSLAWGPWHAGIGRAMGARAVEAWHGFGVTPILPAAGLRALPALLAAPEPHVAVADIDWERVAKATVEPTPRADPGPVTIERLQAVLAPLLGVRDPSTLDPETPLLSFGLDSLTAVEFARALSRELARPIAPDFVYNHPTLAQAARVLAARVLAARRLPFAPEPAGFSLHAPRWEPAPAGRSRSLGWTVAGQGGLAATLRHALAAEPANLVDLSALDLGDACLDAAGREALFPPLLERLRPRQGRSSRIVLVVPLSGPLPRAMEAFATAIAAEQPGWVVRTVRWDGAGGVAALLAELETDDAEPHVRLGAESRQALRLARVVASGTWQASPEATYLVTGASGGIGARVAEHLVARGARNLVLAARRPVLPAPLAGGAARVRLHPVDVADETALVRLFDSLRDEPPLRGIFHIAGVTADGTIAGSGWDQIGRAFPVKADGARLLDRLSRGMGLSEFVLFSSTTAWFGLPGTSGYAAANGFLDGLAEERRAAGLPALSIGWCAWQGVGMAADPALWQDGRVPSLPADSALAALDAALAGAGGEASVVVTEQGWLRAGTRPIAEGPVAVGVGT